MIRPRGRLPNTSRSRDPTKRTTGLSALSTKYNISEIHVATRSNTQTFLYILFRSSTAKRTVIYFEADKTEDTFLPKEYNSIEMR